MKDIYTQALLETLKTNPDTEKVLTGFKNTLNTRGHSKIYTSVLKRVLVQLNSTGSITEVIVANETDAKVFEKEIAKALAEVGGSISDAKTVVDNTIVGGFIAEHDYKRVDSSYKTKLVSLYRSLTT
ncbi:F0F1 ATP synthase subunit delta [Candidatus Kaiserbacteria bacterium]|nr:F0F1 ATP synthase subunit delta [Candidatus Kaiserbacteria bacterium]